MHVICVLCSQMKKRLPLYDVNTIHTLQLHNSHLIVVNSKLLSVNCISGEFEL